MSDERRDDERSPDFRNVELVTTNGGGNERKYPADGENRRVRIVWAKRVADYVQMLGLEEVSEN
jgi:hypothetical protein